MSGASFLKPLEACSFSNDNKSSVLTLTKNSTTTFSITARAVGCVANVTGYKGNFKWTYQGSWANYTYGVKDSTVTSLGSHNTDYDVSDYDYIIILIGSTGTTGSIAITLTDA